jgi:hypothetical protein
MAEGFYSAYAQYLRPASAGGTTVKSTTRTNVYIDLLTLPPAILSPLSNSYVNNNFLLKDSIPEFYLSGSASISFMQGATTITTLALVDNVLKDSFYVNINNISNSTYISSVTNSQIPTGTYNIVLSYQDRYSHPAATTIASNVTIDTSISAPSIISPVPPDTLKSDFNVTFNLPETAGANTVKLVFKNTAVSDTIVVSDTATGNHTLTIYPDRLQTSSDVVSGNGASLADGAYNLELLYNNMVGLSDSAQSSFQLKTDTITLAPALILPATNGTDVTTSNVSFTLPETALANSVQLEFMGCNDDVVTLNTTTAGNHTYTLNGVDLASSTGVVSATSNSLFSGTYAVSLSYQDSSGNPRAYILNRNYAFTNAILGLNFDMLKGYLQMAKTHLQWETATENDLSYFEVEYSKDAKSFSDIGKVKAVGISYIKQNYSFINSAEPLAVNYYRLRMVNVDGTFSYSPVIAVYENNNVAEEFQVYPNPATEKLNVTIITNNTTETHTLKVWDMQGKLVKTIAVQAGSGSNLFSFSIIDLNTGNYVLQDGNNISMFAKLQ